MHIIDVLRGSKVPTRARARPRPPVRPTASARTTPEGGLARPGAAVHRTGRGGTGPAVRRPPAHLEGAAGVRRPVPSLPRLKTPAPAAARGRATSGDYDPKLFQRLRRLRRERAGAAGLPPYIIFSDRALVEMATQCPQNEAQFLGLNGVGEAKLAHYGPDFLRVIREYCAGRGLRPLAESPRRWATRWRMTNRTGSGAEIRFLRRLRPGALLACPRTEWLPDESQSLPDS